MNGRGKESSVADAKTCRRYIYVYIGRELSKIDMLCLAVASRGDARRSDLILNHARIVIEYCDEPGTLESRL